MQTSLKFSYTRSAWIVLPIACAQPLNCVQLFAAPWTGGYQDPLTMEFSGGRILKYLLLQGIFLTHRSNLRLLRPLYWQMYSHTLSLVLCNKEYRMAQMLCEFQFIYDLPFSPFGSKISPVDPKITSIIFSELVFIHPHAIWIFSFGKFQFGYGRWGLDRRAIREPGEGAM